MTDFGVTSAVVIKRLPIDSSEVTATTELTPTDVDRYIEDNAAQFVGLLKNGGITNLDTITPETERQARQFVESASVADCLDQMGLGTVAGYNRYRENANDIYERYAARPNLLNERPRRANYTGDSDKPVRRTFTGRNYEF